jgi:hypothetical protein
VPCSSPVILVAARAWPWPLCPGSRSDRWRPGLDSAATAKITGGRGGRTTSLEGVRNITSAPLSWGFM